MFVEVRHKNVIKMSQMHKKKSFKMTNLGLSIKAISLSNCQRMNLDFTDSVLHRLEA